VNLLCQSPFEIHGLILNKHLYVTMCCFIFQVLCMEKTMQEYVVQTLCVMDFANTLHRDREKHTNFILNNFIHHVDIRTTTSASTQIFPYLSLVSGTTSSSTMTSPGLRPQTKHTPHFVTPYLVAQSLHQYL
jgi:hypothetical protein